MLQLCSMDVLSTKDIDKCKIQETKSSRRIEKKSQGITIYKSMILPEREVCVTNTIDHWPMPLIGEANRKVPTENYSEVVYEQKVSGGNALEIQDETKQQFVQNFISFDSADLMDYKPDISFLEVRYIAICCFVTYCLAHNQFFMGLMFNEPIFKCYNEETKASIKCNEKEYCSNTSLNHLNWPYQSIIKEFNLICGSNIATRHYYENLFFVARAYGPMIFQPLSEIIGKKKFIISAIALSLIGSIITISTKSMQMNFIGYTIAMCGTKMADISCYVFIYETLAPYKKNRLYAGVLCHFIYGITQFSLNLVTLKLYYWKDAMIYVTVLTSIALLLAFFTNNPLIYYLRKGEVSKFLENLFIICINSNQIQIYDSIYDKIDPEKLFRNVKTTKISKNIPFRVKVSSTLKRFCTLKEFLLILSFAYLQGLIHLTINLLVFSQNNIGLENPNYTGMIMGIALTTVPLFLKFVKNIKRVVFIRGGQLVMMIATILMQLIEYSESENQSLKQNQSIVGAVFFRGVGASMIYCHFIYYCELYEAKHRSTALILIWGISNLFVVFIPQYVYLVKDCLGLHVMTGTLAFNMAGYLILGWMPETFGTKVELF